MDFGKRFKFYRQKAKLTQKEAAELIGVNDYQLGNYETNRSEPSLDVLKKMSQVYSVSIDKMLSNNLAASKLTKDIPNTEYIDMDELLTNLNEVVEKMNKAKNQ